VDVAVAPDARTVADAAASPPDVAPALGAASACPPAPAADEVIALFEGNDPSTVRVAGRGGTRFTFLPADPQGQLLATGIPEHCGSRSALEVVGAGFANRSPLAQALLMPGDTGGRPRFYDATAFRGVRFWARASVRGPMRFKVADHDTIMEGNVCRVCNDHYAVDLDVTPDWQLYSVPWTALMQLGAGDKFPALDLTRLFAIEFFPAPENGAFDLWIDDVTFFR
jgi:hypothetical protein